jgi:hypothetical protein
MQIKPRVFLNGNVSKMDLCAQLLMAQPSLTYSQIVYLFKTKSLNPPAIGTYTQVKCNLANKKTAYENNCSKTNKIMETAQNVKDIADAVLKIKEEPIPSNTEILSFAAPAEQEDATTQFLRAAVAHAKQLKGKQEVLKILMSEMTSML